MTEPISVKTRAVTQADRDAVAEQEAIRRSVGDLTFAWASVENAMVMILTSLLNHSTGHMASAIFFTPAGLEGRMSIVDSAVKCGVHLTCVRLPSGNEIKDSLLEEWKSIMTTLNRLRKTRNKVAHGEMTIFGGTETGPGYARLTAPILKMDDGREEAIQSGQKPGLGSNEIMNSTTAVIFAVERLRRFWGLLQSMNKDDSEALLQTLNAAKAQNQNPPDPDSQNP